MLAGISSWSSTSRLRLTIGASARTLRRGEEGIPFGTMIHGEEDASGDMNILTEDFGWTNRQIIRTYNGLADACLLTLVVVYVFFVVRPDRLMGRLWRRG